MMNNGRRIALIADASQRLGFSLVRGFLGRGYHGPAHVRTRIDMNVMPTNTDRTLATVLFTDIVDSTAHAARIGDEAWGNKLDEHNRIAKRLIEQHRGRLIKTTGDGVLATFDGPGRAIRCALGMEPALARLRLSVRAGLHTGEVEDRGKDIGGIAVHAAARVMAHARGGEVLVSRVVVDLVAGSAITFADRGDVELKGVSGTWRLFAVSA